MKIIVSEVLFERENTFLPVDMNKKDLVYKSPEELFGKERQLTTPFWVVGVTMFQLQYGRHPFETHLKPRVMEHLIKKYPIVFPDEINSSQSAVNPDLKSLLTDLLTKDSDQRIGSDKCEMEILQHAYFEE